MTTMVSILARRARVVASAAPWSETWLRSFAVQPHSATPPSAAAPKSAGSSRVRNAAESFMRREYIAASGAAAPGRGRYCADLELIHGAEQQRAGIPVRCADALVL